MDNNIEIEKNKYFFDAIEKIRYSAMQQRTLQNQEVYLRHVKKVMTELKDDVKNLLELGSSIGELTPILEKYIEYVRAVNTDEVWEEYRELEEFEVFREYVSNVND